MFCQYCGKEIPAGTNFCQHCGARIDAGQKNVYQQTGQQIPRTQPRQFTGTTILNSFSVFEIAIIVFMALIALLWLVQALANFKNTRLTADWMEGAAKALCLILYWVPPVLILGLETLGLIELLKKHYVFSVGVILFLVAMMMKIGSWTCNYESIETGAIIACQIFASYSSVAGWTAFFSILITVMLYGKATAGKRII